MSKQEFLEALRKGLTGLPQEDIEHSVDFYSEMIDDRMEDGLSEEDAVAAIGSVKDIISQILSETKLTKLVKAKVKPNRKLKTWEIVLLILGSPLWLPLLLAGVCIILSVYIVIWSVIISLYAIDLSFAACSIVGVLGLLAYIPSGNFAGAAFLFGAGLVCGGIAILLLFCFNKISKAILLLSKKILLVIKSSFIRKGSAQ